MNQKNNQRKQNQKCLPNKLEFEIRENQLKITQLHHVIGLVRFFIIRNKRSSTSSKKETKVQN